MPELVRAVRPATDLRAYRGSCAGDPPAPARRGPHAQLQGGDRRPGGGLARAGAGRRAHDPRPAVRAVRIAVEEPALRRAGAVGGAAVPRDRQRLRRDDRAGAGGRGRPARAVPDRLQRHGRRGVPEPPPAPRRGPPRAGPGRRRGRLRHGRPALRAEGARRHPGRRAGGPARRTRRSDSSSSATACSATG